MNTEEKLKKELWTAELINKVKLNIGGKNGRNNKSND